MQYDSASLIICTRTLMLTRITMCHNIITRSIHCDDPFHGDYHKVHCQNMWFANWQKVVKCKKQRDLKIETAEECQSCQIEGPKPAVEPWESILPTTPPRASIDNSRDNSPEVWTWSDAEISIESSDSEHSTDSDIEITPGDCDGSNTKGVPP